MSIEEYNKKGKQILIDREELLLKIILDFNIKSTTYTELSEEMNNLGHTDYVWQMVKADLKKLGITKYIKRRKTPVIAHIDLNKAKRKAEQRKVDISMDLSSCVYSDFVSMDYVDLLNGFEFEFFLKLLFQKMGYKVINTNLSSDQGADLIISRLNSKIVIQAKNYGSKVSNKAVQEVLASIRYYDADRGLVVTNSFFTNSAIKLAEANDIDLIDRYKLEHLIKEYPISESEL